MGRWLDKQRGVSSQPGLTRWQQSKLRVKEPKPEPTPVATQVAPRGPTRFGIGVGTERAYTPQDILKMGYGPIRPEIGAKIKAWEAVRKPSFKPRQNIIKTIGQEMMRAPVSFALRVIGKKTATPRRGFEETLLGTRPIFEPGIRIKEAAKKTSQFFGKAEPELPSYLLGGAGVAGMTIIETWFGGGKTMAKGIIKEVERATGKAVTRGTAIKIAREVSEVAGKKLVGTARNEAIQTIRNKYIPKAVEAIKPITEPAKLLKEAPMLEGPGFRATLPERVPPGPRVRAKDALREMQEEVLGFTLGRGKKPTGREIAAERYAKEVVPETRVETKTIRAIFAEKNRLNMGESSFNRLKQSYLPDGSLSKATKIEAQEMLSGLKNLEPGPAGRTIIPKTKVLVSQARREPISGYVNIVDPKHGPSAEIANKITPSGKTIPAIRSKSGFFANKEIETHMVKDVYSQTKSPLNISLEMDNVAREGGKFGPIYNHMHQPTQESLGNMIVWGNNQAIEFRMIAKKHKLGINSKTGEALTDVMEKIPNKELETGGVVQLTSKYKIENTNLIRAAKDYRKLLDDMRIDANKVRKALGKDEIGYVESYAPHMQESSFWNQLLEDPKNTISDNLDFIIPNEKTNPFAMKRLGGEFKREKNFFKLADSYTSAISKDVHLTPAIENIKVHNEVLKGRGLTNTGKYWDQYVREGLVGKLSKFDQAMGLEAGGKGVALAHKIQEIRIKGGLVGNLIWSATTQPSSLALTVKETGLMKTLRGALDWFTDPKLRKQVAELSSMRIKTGREATVAYRGYEQFANRIYKSKVDNFNDLITTLMNAEERHLHGMSIAAGLREGKRLGYAGDDLWHFANTVGERTQSMYNRGSRPLMMNSEIGKTAFPFQTFMFEMMGHVKEIAGRAGMSASKRTRLGMLINLMAGIYIANEYTKAVRGRAVYTPGSFLPYVGPITEEVAYKLFKPEKQYISPRAPIAPLEDIVRLVDGTKRFIDVGDTYQLRKLGTVYGMGLLGLGGASQVNRFVDGMLALEKGYQPTRTGKIAFEVPPEETVKVLVGGPYMTKAGKEYLEKGEDIRKYQIEAGIESEKESRLARKIYDEIKAASTQEEKQTLFNQYMQSGELTDDIVDRITTFADEEALGLTARERSLKSMRVEQRAEYILDQIKDMDTEEKREFIGNMIVKKILTDSIAEILINKGSL